MALREQARRIAADREGYRLVRLTRRGECRTTFIISHKGRAVGGYVEYFDGAAPEAAGSVREAADWWESDRCLLPIGV